MNQMGDEARAMRLMNLTAGMHSYKAVLGMVKKHPQRHDDNILAEEIFGENFNEDDWLSGTETTNSDSDSDSIEYVNEQRKGINLEKKEEDEDVEITNQLLGVLGDMYQYKKVLEIVKNHPTKYNIEAVMDSVLESINLDTVDGQWLRNASNGISSM